MKIKLLLAYMLIALITIGCGGGGGSSQKDYTNSLKYTGKTTQAKLNENNEKDYLDLINNSFSNLANTLTDNEVAFGKNANYKLLKNLNSKNLKVVDTQTLKGSKGGTLEIETDQKSYTELEITYTYKDYQTSEVYLDGVVVVNAKLNASRDETDTLTFKMLKSKSINEDIIIDGTIKIYSPSSTMTSSDKKFIYRNKIEENYTVKDNLKNKMYKFNNFVSYLDDLNFPLYYKGKVYHSDYGYINVKTLKNFKYSGETQVDATGFVKLEGKSSYVNVKYAYDGRYRVEIDKNNDKKIDSVKIYTISKTKSFVEVKNKKPVVKITLPKFIYTNSDLSKTKLKIYDPDLDKIKTTYKWSVNDKVVSTTKNIDNSLFKKHDKLELCVSATDKTGTTTTCKKKDVSNSLPKIDIVFKDIYLKIGEKTKIEDYKSKITDADNDKITVSWKHYKMFENSLEDVKKMVSIDDKECQTIIDMYETETGQKFSNLPEDEQTKFKQEHCSATIDGYKEIVDVDFIKGRDFLAYDDGVFAHQLIISDGDNEVTRLLFSDISKMQIIDKVIKAKEIDESFPKYNMYIKDFNNDGKKEIIYTQNKLDDNGDMQINLIVEQRDNQKAKKIKTYTLDTDNDVDNFTNYYLGNFNKDKYTDIITTQYNNISYDFTTYKTLYQNKNGSLNTVSVIEGDKYKHLKVANIIGDKTDDIVIQTEIDYEDSDILIVSKDKNITIAAETKDSIKMLVKDINNDSNKDIVLIERSSTEYDNNYTLTLKGKIYLQDDAEDFQEYNVNFKLANYKDYDSDYIVDVKIADFKKHKNTFVVASENYLYILEYSKGKLKIKKKMPLSGYGVDGASIEIVDINHDGKKDIVIINNGYYGDIRVFIQIDSFDFLQEQVYSLEKLNINYSDLAYVLGDIDNDKKYELYFNNNSNKLNVIYFK